MRFREGGCYVYGDSGGSKRFILVDSGFKIFFRGMEGMGGVWDFLLLVVEVNIFLLVGLGRGWNDRFFECKI